MWWIKKHGRESETSLFGVTPMIQASDTELAL